MMGRALDGEAAGVADSAAAPRAAGSAESLNAQREAPGAEPGDCASRVAHCALLAGDTLAPNFIILPPPAVMVPFPVGPAVEGGGGSRGSGFAEVESGLAAAEALSLEQAVAARLRAQGDGQGAGSGGSARRAARIALQEDGGSGLTGLKMLPDEPEESTPDNIEVIDFRPPAEGKILRLPMAALLGAGSKVSALQPAPALGEVSGEAATSHLPGGEVSREEFAHPGAAEGPGVGLPENSRGVAKAIAHGGLPRVGAGADLSAEATGISAARQDCRMDSMKNSGQGKAWAGRGQEGAEEFPPPAHESCAAEFRAAEVSARISGAMDWQLGRPVGSLDRPSPVSPAPLSPEQSATVERISSLISRETSLVRQYSADSMAVVLRPDDGTELYVHFARRHGQIEATIRCDRGDAQQLGALWPQLQEALAQQRVRLAPLQDGPSTNSNFNQPTGFGASGEGSGSQRHSSSEQQSMDERSVPASSISDVLHGQRRRGSRRRLTTSRPGWETWA